MATEWRSDDVESLIEALLAMRTPDEMAALLRDLCTLGELEALGHRLAAARLLDTGLPYTEIAARVGGSTTTVTRVAQWLRHGEGGYRMAIDRTSTPA